jgi:hypothetical protein
MNSRELELELLNFEGPVLKAIKTEKGFAIVDQHKVQLTVLDYDRLMKFFRSELSIMDSTGRFWKYSEHSDDAKPSQESIAIFLQKSGGPTVSDDFQIGPNGAYEHSDREINFKELLTIVSSKLKIVNYTTGDLSDLGNEIGITVGTHIKEMTASEISQFISGFRHGVSLTNNTH